MGINIGNGLNTIVSIINSVNKELDSVDNLKDNLILGGNGVLNDVANIDNLANTTINLLGWTQIILILDLVI